MFLKKIVVLLVIANSGYFAYTQGWFNVITGGDAAQREPERMNRQINTEAVQITVTTLAEETSNTSAVSNSAPTGAGCTSTPANEQWLVYMGPYANKELQNKKKNELTRLSISATEVSKPSLKLGLSLGSYASEAQAREALATLNTQGIQTATVVLWATQPASRLAACPQSSN